MNNETTSDEILGKEVVNKEGEILGIVQKLHIDRNTKQIIGITIDEGFMKPDLFIGIDAIKFFGIDAIILNTTTNIKFKNLKVYDKDGNLIGSVEDFKLVPKTHKLKEITVKTSMNKKEIIPAKKIRSIGINVILK